MSDKILCPSCQTVKEREATCFFCHTPGETARIAGLSKPRIVAECWTCGHRNAARRRLPDFGKGISQRRANVCMSLRHDVQPVEPQRGE